GAGPAPRVRLTTCETVETETPASLATSAIVDTPPPEMVCTDPAPHGGEPGFCGKGRRWNVCAIVYMFLFTPTPAGSAKGPAESPFQPRAPSVVVSPTRSVND